MATSGNYGPLRSKAGTGSNAYMLVYVRVADWPRIMCAVDKADIPDHLRSRLEAELADKEDRQRMKADAHQFATLRVVTDHELRDQVRARGRVLPGWSAPPACLAAAASLGSWRRTGMKEGMSGTCTASAPSAARL